MRGRSHDVRRAIAWVMYWASAGVFAFLCSVTVVSCFGSEAVFYVAAQTERVEFSGYTASNKRWTFQDAALEIGDWRRKCTPGADVEPASEREKEEAGCFSGSIEVAQGVSGFVERIGDGPLWVHAECPTTAPCGVARVFDADDNFLRTAETPIDLWVDNVAEKARQGKTTLISLSGAVRPGRDVGVETPGSTAVLRHGTVSVMVRKVLGNDRFEARKETLRAGDLFFVSGDSVATAGFAVANEQPALTAAYRVSGEHAYIQRPGGGEPTPVAATLFQRILSDDVFQVIAGLLTCISGLATFVQFGMSVEGVPDADVDVGPK